MTNILSITALIVVFGQSQAIFECYCNTGHPQYPIYECPVDASSIIGLLDRPDQVVIYHNLDDPYCTPVLNFEAPAGWVSVYHYHQVGYLMVDAGFIKTVCPGDIMFNVGNLIKSNACQHKILGKPSLVLAPTQLATAPTPTPTKALAWVTVPQVTKHFSWQAVPTGNSCDGSRVMEAIAKQDTIFSSQARPCRALAYSEEEGVVMALCAAPSVKDWKKGSKVLGNCSNVQKNTPVSVFIGDNAAGGRNSGIFVECTATSIKVARQVCSRGFVEVVELPRFIAANIYVIEW